MKNKGFINFGPNWPIVLVAFYGCCLHSGCLIYAFSLFINPLQIAFGWDFTDIMMAFTLQMLCVGLASPLVGKAMDMYGVRRVISFGALVSAVGFALVPLISTPLHFYLCNIIIGMGSSAMGPVPCSAAVTQCFKEKRGLAIGIMSTGIGVGGFVIAPLVAGVFLPYFGWQGAYVCLAFITITMIPMSLIFLKTKSENCGHTATNDAGQNIGTEASNAKNDLLSLPFIFLAVTFFLFLFSVAGVTQIQVPYLQDIGFPLLTASSALGGLGLVSSFGKLMFGCLCDRYQPKNVFMIGAFFAIAGIFLLRRITPESSPVLLWTYAVFFGIGVGSWLPTMSMLVSSTFGVASYGVIFGAVSMALSIGAATGPLAAGYIYDQTGNYQPAFSLLMVLAVCSMGIILAFGYRVKKSRTSACLCAN